jgi:hypothetical protein
LNDAEIALLPADCEMLIVCPPIVTVGVRAAPVLAAIVSVTEPLPVPLSADGVTDESDVVTVHAHVVVDAVIVIVAVPPLLPTDTLVGDTLIVHDEGVRNVSVGEKSLVTTPLVARACQYQRTSLPSVRVTVQLVVEPLPCGTLSTVNVRAGSFGNVGWSETSK